MAEPRLEEQPSEPGADGGASPLHPSLKARVGAAHALLTGATAQLTV